MSVLHEAQQRRRPVPIVDALRIQAMVLARQERRDKAARMWQDAASLAHPMPYPYGEARALYEWGRTLVEQGEGEQAQTRLEEALTIFQRLGARPYIDWTEQALVRLGAEVM